MYVYVKLLWKLCSIMIRILTKFSYILFVFCSNSRIHSVFCQNDNCWSNLAASYSYFVVIIVLFTAGFVKMIIGDQIKLHLIHIFLLQCSCSQLLLLITFGGIFFLFCCCNTLAHSWFCQSNHCWSNLVASCSCFVVIAT